MRGDEYYSISDNLGKLYHNEEELPTSTFSRTQYKDRRIERMEAYGCDHPNFRLKSRNDFQPINYNRKLYWLVQNGFQDGYCWLIYGSSFKNLCKKFDNAEDMWKKIEQLEKQGCAWDLLNEQQAAIRYPWNENKD